MESRLGNAQSYVALGSEGRMVGRRNRSGVRGIDQSLANASTTGQRLGNRWFELWLSCCSMIPRSPRSKTDPSPSNLRGDPMLRKAGFERQRYRNHPRWSSRVHGSNTPGIRANAVLPNPSIEGRTSRAGALAAPCQTLNIMKRREVSTQLSGVVGVIERSQPTLLAVHLYGSAVDGGLKPHSDIDLLVTVTVRLDETTRRL